jgi:hypothetical protein
MLAMQFMLKYPSTARQTVSSEELKDFMAEIVGVHRIDPYKAMHHRLNMLVGDAAWNALCKSLNEGLPNNVKFSSKGGVMNYAETLKSR